MVKKLILKRQNVIEPIELTRGIYLYNLPSLQAFLLLHLLIDKADSKIYDNTIHEISLDEILTIKHIKDFNKEDVTSLFLELHKIIIQDKNNFTTFGLIDSILFKEEKLIGSIIIQWRFNSKFCEKAKDLFSWNMLEKQIINYLKSKYARILYEDIINFKNLTKLYSKTFSALEIREFFDVSPQKIPIFSDVNHHVVKRAMAEINNKSPLKLSQTLEKKGKIITNVIICWR